MKILLVSMNSIHFVRWAQQLENSGHDVYWFDILDGGSAAQLPRVNQITGWKQKFPKLKGRYFLKEKLLFLYKRFSYLIEHDVAKIFESTIQEIKPDLVHSFVLYVSCTPILKVMKKHPSLPWLYSSWGSDLYYYRNIKKYRKGILTVLPRVDYLITDCERDIAIAKDLGFKGKVLGTFPGGGGFEHDKTQCYIKPISERSTILVKGYQGRSGRAIAVLKALSLISENLKNHPILIFAADDEVEDYIIDQKNSNLSLTILSRNSFLPHDAILKLMGEALIYIGNSNSDGMPNTLLEAISMGAFPIQSNPGGASAEVIVPHENGLLIEDFDNIEEIKALILTALNNPILLEKAFHINQNKVKPRFESTFIKKQVLEAYEIINENNKII